MLVLILLAIAVPVVSLYRRGPGRGRLRTVLLGVLSVALVVAVAVTTNLLFVVQGRLLTNFTMGPDVVVYHLKETDGRYLTLHKASGSAPEAFSFASDGPGIGGIIEVPAQSMEVTGSHDPTELGMVTLTTYRWYNPLLYPIEAEHKSKYSAVVSVAESDEINSRP